MHNIRVELIHINLISSKKKSCIVRNMNSVKHKIRINNFAHYKATYLYSAWDDTHLSVSTQTPNFMCKWEEKESKK